MPFAFFPLQDIVTVIQGAGKKLTNARKDLLEAIGIQALSFVELDYREKSRGNVGADGTRWAPLKPETIIRKAGGRKKFDLAARSKRKTTKTGKVRPTNSITQGIGIDTGLQFNSATPGYIAPDGKGGNVFRVEGFRVIVGFGRSYSVYFDAKRKLIPTTIPQEWQDRFEEMAATQGLEILDKELKSL